MRYSLFIFRIIITGLFCQLGFWSSGQVSGFYYAKEFSKDISLYRAKAFVIENIIGASENVVKFEIDPLAASNSGELTSLIYQSDEKKKEGLILGFYGNYWNESGVVYQGYAFKNLPKQNALKLLDIIDKAIDDNMKYMKQDFNTNNIYFKYDDMTFLIYLFNTTSYKIRVFWKNFDSEWTDKEYERTRKRLKRKLD